jgi:hypothetical protein
MVEMTHVFQYDNVVAGVLVLVVGFAFHWMGQGLSVINWDLATRLGLQDKGMPQEYKVYEHAIAVADVSVGWIYGLAGVGLLIGASWGYKLAWVPGAIFLYHAISFWAWTGNQRRAGRHISTGGTAVRVGWTVANAVAGLVAVLVAWNAT